jgi:hypothetical protein
MNQEIIKSVLDIINGKKITCNELLEEDFIDALEQFGVTLCIEPDSTNRVDEHRWYSLVECVYKIIYDNECYGYIKGFVGDRVYSEEFEWEYSGNEYQFKQVYPHTQTEYYFNDTP